MFCKNCGEKLEEGTAFCPACGTKLAESIDRSDSQEAKANASGSETNTEARSERPESDKNELARNIILKIWNSPLFTKAAIKFGNILEILEGIIFLVSSIALFKGGGFWGIVFGIIFGLGGIGSCIVGAMSLLSRRKNQEESEPESETDSQDINKKKRNLCIGVVVIIIALIIVKNTGGGTYSIVKSISFDNMGPETIGELIDRNIKNPEWSQKKLDSDFKLVYVEGYYPAYGETIKIEFTYEKLDDGSHEVSLNKMYLPDSNEELNALETSFVWSSFYN